MTEEEKLQEKNHLKAIITDLPAIGCAKSRLVCTYQEPKVDRGSRSVLLLQDEIIVVVLRTKNNVKPIFISVGHKIDLEAAVKLVLYCSTGYRLPERLADQLVNEHR